MVSRVHWVAIALLAAVPSSADIASSLQQLVDEGEMAGAVTIVAARDRIVDVSCAGWSDLKRRKPMRTNDLFWIASMTKPITAVAVLMLQEEGRLSIDDAVEKYLPEFRDTWLIASDTGGMRVVIRPGRPITLRDLLTHTAGLDHVPAPRAHCSLAELVMAYAQRPLKFAPGSRWEYCNAGIDTVGRIVEVVSGLPFETFLQDRLFDPLHMGDTTFWPDEEQAVRVARSYRKRVGGGLEETKVFILGTEVTDRRRTPLPSGGLYSTAQDVVRFYQMMLNNGVSGGRRILTPQSVAMMTRTQSGDIKTGFTAGMSWGLGFQVLREPQGITAQFAPGTFGHGGAYGTHSWADPVRGRVYVLMAQVAEPEGWDEWRVRRAFQELAAALPEPKAVSTRRAR